MRTIASLFVGLFLLMAATAAIMVSTLIYAVMKLLPLLLLAAVVVFVLRLARPRSTPPAAVRNRARVLPPAPSRGPQPGYGPYAAQPGWGSAQPTGGWVLMPVFVPAAAPRARGDVIDAEVISTEDGHG